MNTSILGRKRRQTLTLEQRAAGTHHLPPTPPATAARKSPAPLLAEGRPRGAPLLAVRDAGGTSACGLGAPPPSHSTAARSRMGGARAPARGSMAAPATPPPRSPWPWSSWPPPFNVERERGEWKWARVSRETGADRFSPAGGCGRPLDQIRRPRARRGLVG